MIFHELYRFYFIIRIILHYGLNDFFSTKQLIFPLKIINKFLLRTFNKYPNLILGERFRLALQTLGPIWIKLGQMLSTRRDIFSNSITDQLAILQDRVQPFDGTVAKKYIEHSIGNSLEKWFKDFQEIPIASASISQVHAAKFKHNNQDVIIKIIRPNILPIIQTDIRLMYRISHWIHKLLPKNRNFKFSQIISEYEKNLLNELNLMKETANTIQLRRNFKNSKKLYIPKVYVNFCRKNVMVMERIYGIPIYDILKLKQHGMNMQTLAQQIVEIFFKQVFKDNFFHGDMHPGNIFVNCNNPKRPIYISVDCGIIGSINQNDQYYLASNFIAFFHRDYRKIAELHLNSGWIPINTNLKDFENAIRTIFEPIFEQPLKNIFFSEILLYLFNIIQNFHVEIQPQLILLQKTLLYIEGIVRQLYPHLNLWEYTNPFLKKWMSEQLKLSKIIYTIKDNIPYWANKIPNLSTSLVHSIQNLYIIQEKVESLFQENRIKRAYNYQALFLFGIGSILVIISTLLFTQKTNSQIFSTIFFILGILIWIIGWKRITY